MQSFLHLVLAAAIVGASAAAAAVAGEGIRFGNAYGSHMVLQQAPNRAVVKGFASGDKHKISVLLQSSGSPPSKGQTFTTASAEDGSWLISLDPVKTSNTTYTLTASDLTDGTEATISDVLFGDVWVCSGQSNMAFLVEMAFNGSTEVQNANDYPFIRLFTTAKVASNTSLTDLPKPELPWSVASNKTISQNSKGANDDDWLYFSAVCWFFGRDLYNKLQYPIGLVNTNWGGTTVESWSSPDAIDACYPKSHPSDSSIRWRGMVEPLLSQTIKGAIWYQGEANSNSPHPNYDCTFPAMIDDWRTKWSKGTSGATDPLFPFGFVQLSSQAEETIDINFPALRWAQTADYGFVPNTRQQNVFMAVAYDIGDLASPYDSIHPRYKQDVGDRLVRGALDTVYNIKTYWQGPLLSSASAKDGGILVTFSNPGADGIELRQSGGWEVCMENPSRNITCFRNDIPGWYPTNATALAGSDGVVVATPPQVPQASHIRYVWRTYPCSYKACGVYAKSEGLPTPPFWAPVH